MDKKKYEEQLAAFYSNLKEVWPENDKWHVYTHTTISDFVKEHIEKKEGFEKKKILNCGSGGMTYGLTCDMYHMDIVENKINHFSHWKVASAEKIPFLDEEFDIVICVGTVINYCDAASVISELNRVLKKGGFLYLEFETSGSVEYIFSDAYFKNKGLVKSKYFGKEHIFWVYSYPYIKKLLHRYGLRVTEEKYMHILSTFAYRLIPLENFAGRFQVFDPYLQHKKIRKHAANIVIEVVKGERIS